MVTFVWTGTRYYVEVTLVGYLESGIHNVTAMELVNEVGPPAALRQKIYTAFCYVVLIDLCLMITELCPKLKLRKLWLKLI